jgi:hypothetical protein
MPYQWHTNFSNKAANRMLSATGGTRGLIVTASGVANTKGAWTSDATALVRPAEALTINVGNSSAAANHVIDIGYSFTASAAFHKHIVAGDLRLASTKAIAFGAFSITIPVYVPNGATLFARSASSTASATCDVSILCHSTGILGMPGFRSLWPLYTPSSSAGVSIDAGAVANTKGSWTQITSSSAQRAVGLMAMVGPASDVARAAASFLFDIGVGPSGSEVVYIPNLMMSQEAAVDCPLPQSFGPFPCDIPSGSRLAARCQSTTTTAGDRTFDLALYGLVL